MNTSMHGKQIDRIATSEGCYIYSGAVTGRDSTRMELSATYHGDRDEFWVLLIRNGSDEEVCRYNAKTLHAIEWSRMTTTATDSEEGT